jgi:hypothetical protein
MPSGMRQSIEKISRVAQADYVIGAGEEFYFGLNSSRQLSVRPLCKCQSPLSCAELFGMFRFRFRCRTRLPLANVTDTMLLSFFHVGWRHVHQAKREIRIN